eukprot:XP_011248115.1 PREDICTED: sp110 nuclear body protein-like [Mus musculus]
MFTLTKALEKALLQHFIYMKVNITYAINKPFPFFEALRDKSFITERMYKESLEACQNLVPLSKVVHNILTSLEQTFHPSVLLTLFSKVNLREYPSLVAIFRSFRNGNVVSPILVTCAVVLHCRFSIVPFPGHLPSLLPYWLESLFSLPLWPLLAQPESLNSFSSLFSVSSRDHQRKDKEDSREMPHSPSGPESVVKDNLTSKTNKQDDSGAWPLGSPGTIHVVKDDSPAAHALAMAQEVPCTPANKKARRKKHPNWSNSKRRQQKKKPCQDEMMGVASPGHGVQEKLKAVSRRTLWKDDSSTNVKEVTKTLRARMRCAQTSNSQEISKEASKTSGIKRPSTARRTTQGKDGALWVSRCSQRGPTVRAARLL